MKKAFRVVLIVLSLTAFAFATSALAEEFFVVKEAGKMVVTDKKPADVKDVVKGPFKTKAEADAALKAAAGTAKPKPPTTGC
ncbi:MAG: hypothetical protein NTY51_14565 [Deltaproteobacteria bacterium]|nr:hypothetical protein [Deltaproteobacteria bacterium]